MISINDNNDNNIPFYKDLSHYLKTSTYFPGLPFHVAPYDPSFLGRRCPRCLFLLLHQLLLQNLYLVLPALQKAEPDSLDEWRRNALEKWKAEKLSWLIPSSTINDTDSSMI